MTTKIGKTYKQNETSTTTLNKLNEKKNEEKNEVKNTEKNTEVEEFVIEEYSEVGDKEINKVRIQINKTIGGYNVDAEADYNVDAEAVKFILRDKNLNKKTCKPIINPMFCNETFIYQIKENLFNKIKNDENLSVSSYYKSYLIATVLNNGKYYLIVCRDATPIEKNETFCGLFEKSTNECVKIIRIGDKLTSFDSLLYNCSNLKNFKCFANTVNVESCNDMFGKCNGLEKIDLECIKTDKITELRGMFKNCKNLEIVKFPKFKNKLAVEDMFEGCDNLKNIYDDKNVEIRNELNKLKEKKNKKIKKNTKKKKS